MVKLIGSVVGAVVGVLGPVLAYSGHGQVPLEALLPSAVGGVVIGWVSPGLFAGTTAFVRHGRLLDRERADAAELDAEGLRVQRDAQGKPPAVRIEREQPVLEPGQSRLLRLRVHNDNPGGQASLAGEVVGLRGTPEWGPEPPWHVAWRHGGNAYSRPVRGRSSEIVDFARAPVISIEGARARDIESWYPVFGFIVVGVEGEDAITNYARLDGITNVDEVAGHEMSALLRIHHEESGEMVAEKRIALFFQERDGTLWPDLRVDENV